MQYGSDYSHQLNIGRATMSKGLMLFAGNSHLEFAREVARHLDTRLHEPDLAIGRGQQIKWFSNQNCMVDIKVNVRGRHCFVIQTQAPGRALIGKDDNGVEKFGEDLRVSDMIMELLLLVDGLKSAGAAKVTVVMPYMPYIRSDKKDHSRVCIGARLLLDLIREAGTDGILLMDPHFEQIHGFCRQRDMTLDVLEAKAIFARYFLENLDLENYAVIAPDVSESKHSGPIATLLGLPIAIIDKRRVDDNEKTKQVHLIGKEDVRGRDGIMMDDEVASGGTVNSGAEYSVQEGVKSVLPAPTHPVFSSMEGLHKLQDDPNISQIVCADTIPISAEKRRILTKLHVLPVSKYFADAIAILHDDGDLEEYRDGLHAGLKELRSKLK